MRKIFRIFRHKLARLIAPDLINDLEYRLSAFLCSQTGNMYSKPYYSLRDMLQMADDYSNRICEECEYYKKCIEDGENNE